MTHPFTMVVTVWCYRVVLHASGCVALSRSHAEVKVSARGVCPIRGKATSKFPTVFFFQGELLSFWDAKLIKERVDGMREMRDDRLLA